ncbi:MAG: hypothetical protein DMG07_28290 [Acidobacteria bacterium]|nr:MAG: hypothetical protein DMG07_28290 [Acidobacteriota bacterium]
MSMRKILPVTFVLSTLALAPAGSGQPEGNRPLTITPYSAAAYVQDRAAVELISAVAEFPIGLLRWSDTPRPPVLELERSVKAAVNLFYTEWSAGGPAKLGARDVLPRVRDWYRSLQSPRLAHLTVADGLEVRLPSKPVDIVGDAPAEVPFIFANERSTRVTVVLRPAGSTPLQTVELGPGWTLGRWVRIPPGPAPDGPVRLVAEVGGARRESELPVRRWPRATARIRVLDEKGAPTAARIYLTGPDGRAYAPSGAVHRSTCGDYRQPYAGDYYFYMGGAFEVDVPAGEVEIEAVKGFEYAPARRRARVEAGKRNRPWDMAARGWYSGDVHIHPNLFAQSWITPRDVLEIARAEDLNVSNLLVCNDPSGFMNDLSRFEGKPHALSGGRYLLYWNEEMRNLRVYGHVGFLNLKRCVVPSWFGWPLSPVPYDYPSNYNQAVAAKAQGGVVTYVHPGLPSEYPVDIALGAADTIDVMCQGDEERNTADWYRLLNCGFRCPISAGTDCFLNIPYHLIAGAGRLYVQTGGALGYDRWIDGYLKGRSFASNAPLLTFTVEGHAPGEEVRAPAGPLRVRIRAEAVSHVPMAALEVVVNGRTVLRREATDSHRIAVAEEVTLDRTSWVALRARGGGHRLVPNDAALYAHTSPVYFQLGDDRPASKEDALYFVDKINALIARVGSDGVFEKPEQREEVIRLFRKGQERSRRRGARRRAPDPPP